LLEEEEDDDEELPPPLLELLELPLRCRRSPSAGPPLPPSIVSAK
jgi:hypothetical protein